MNDLSVETIMAVDTGNYTAWTSLTSCIMANGSLLMAAGLMAAAQRRHRRRSARIKNRVNVSISRLPKAVKLQVDRMNRVRRRSGSELHAAD